MSKVVIEQKGYKPVECDQPLPCPFCGDQPELAQLAHVTRYERIGRSKKLRPVKVTILASTNTLVADTYWFKCKRCGCTSGPHCDTAQEAALSWNRRHVPQADQFAVGTNLHWYDRDDDEHYYGTIVHVLLDTIVITWQRKRPFGNPETELLTSAQFLALIDRGDYQVAR